MRAIDVPLLLALFVVAVMTGGAMAVRSASRIWLRHWAERRLRGAATAIHYLERPHRLLFAAASGTAATLVVAGVLLGVRSANMALVGQTVVFIALVIVVGQMIPRAIARRWPAVVVPVTLPALRLAEITAAPVAVLGRLFARRWQPSIAEEKVEERESIQDLLREGELEGVGGRDEIAIISGVVAFGEKRLADVMTPRREIFAIDADGDPHAITLALAQSAYSRIPVYRGTLDEIVGLVLAFDVLKIGGDALPPIRPVSFALPDAPCNDLLFRMLRDRRHMAIVRDAGGHTVGLVTLEDLLEELVGDISDEHDEPEPARAQSRPDGR